MKNILTYVFLAIIPILSYIILGKIFKGNHKWMIFIISVEIFIFSFLIFKFGQNKISFKNFILPLPLFTLIFFVSFQSGFSFTLFYLIFIPFSSVLGVFYAKQKSQVILFVSIFIFAIASSILYPNWIVYSENRDAKIISNYKSIEFLDKENNIKLLDNKEIIVLDFWSTSCSICFKQFPKFEKIYLEYKNTPNLEIYSINVPSKGDSIGEAQNIVKKLGYKFPTLYVNSKEDIVDLNIDSYPRLVIVKNNKVRYNGRLEMDGSIFVNHIKHEINKLLKE